MPRILGGGYYERQGYRTTPAYEGQMASFKSKSGTTYYRNEQPKPSKREQRTVYIIKGGKLGSWRGYNETEARANVEKYGGKLSSKKVTTLG